MQTAGCGPSHITSYVSWLCKPVCFDSYQPQGALWSGVELSFFDLLTYLVSLQPWLDKLHQTTEQLMTTTNFNIKPMQAFHMTTFEFFCIYTLCLKNRAHISDKVGNFSTVLLRAPSRTCLPTFIEIGANLTELEQKILSVPYRICNYQLNRFTFRPTQQKYVGPFF